MWALMTASEAEAMGELGTIAAGVLGSLRAGRKERKKMSNTSISRLSISYLCE